ncbi:MAG TPA: saccharopine dehydrogenase C-terminal domain-containing protein [Steroidobacteraceae bacterium]|nr:saccharopine dehydrogenase C-terminal domain-containing protein [Steroidobacteraceae bacterium]
MHILVLGGGLMGPAAAAEALRDPATSSVTVADISQSSLNACRARLAREPRVERLRTEVADVREASTIDRMLMRADAVVSALPWAVARGVMEAAAQRGAPVVDLARVPDAEWASAQARLSNARGLIVVGCGVEPGLTEILARRLAEQLDEVDEVHIKCGGVPEHPSGPLGYKIVFGGRSLPLKPSDGYAVENGQLTSVPRYSGVEPVAFAGLGELEAWHEGFMPWLLDLKCMTNLKRGTQKTIRWPGYAAKATFLKEAGLLNPEPIEVDGVCVSPKRVLDTVMESAVRMSETDRDITLLRVDVVGRSGGRPRALRAEMVDRHDGVFTSMARTTAFTASIVARLAAAGRLARPPRSPATPEQVVTGAAFDELIAALAASGVRIEIREM